jgi:two-component system chemotaxis sensor kinase CheA
MEVVVMDLEILHDYLIESKELLQGAQEDTLGLEADSANDQILASIFRAFHTIKGGASFSRSYSPGRMGSRSGRSFR